MFRLSNWLRRSGSVCARPSTSRRSGGTWLSASALTGQSAQLINDGHWANYCSLHDYASKMLFNVVKCSLMMVKCSSMLVKWVYDPTLLSPLLFFFWFRHPPHQFIILKTTFFLYFLLIYTSIFCEYPKFYILILYFNWLLSVFCNSKNDLKKFRVLLAKTFITQRINPQKQVSSKNKKKLFFKGLLALHAW